TASAARLYGDEMERLWGEIVAVPEANLRVLSGGEAIGPWRVEYTPGHASHHVSYYHEPTGTAFVGDVGGVRVEGAPITPTPPARAPRPALRGRRRRRAGRGPADHPAHAPARHRHRSVARVARHRCG